MLLSSIIQQGTQSHMTSPVVGWQPISIMSMCGCQESIKGRQITHQKRDFKQEMMKLWNQYVTTSMLAVENIQGPL